MIYNEKTIFPVLVIDEHDSWDRLPSITDDYLDIYGLDKLKRLLDGKISAIVIEKEYFDKDYRDTFSNYHSKRFNTPKSRCVRLHFFKENPYSEENRCLKIDSVYLGYSIIRPTRPNSVGRTLVHIGSGIGTSGYVCLCEENVNIGGQSFTVKGFPFVTQDADATVCAQSALWMLLRYFSNHYNNYQELNPFEITQLIEGYSIGRIYPSTGLTMWQMAEVLRKTGFSPVIYSRESHKEIFEQLLYIYIESGLPLLIGIPNHVVVGVGHKETKLNQIKNEAAHNYTLTSTKGFIVNDDNRIPYTDEYDLEKIDSFIVPLPEKVFLTAEKFLVCLYKLFEHDKYGIDKADEKVFRVFLTTCKSFRKELFRRNLENTDFGRVYRNIPLPHFIWVCEISTPELMSRHEVVGEIIWDATRNEHEATFGIAVHHQDKLFIDVGSIFNNNDNYQEFQVENISYQIYTNNLEEV